MTYHQRAIRVTVGVLLNVYEACRLRRSVMLSRPKVGDFKTKGRFFFKDQPRAQTRLSIRCPILAGKKRIIFYKNKRCWVHSSSSAEDPRRFGQKLAISVV